ncbi:hypothetical protein C8J56DRAFT_1008382 [Mycena floridula]|nr:hypothetical protein C8J56DRAFT_1008382 [Mycena floridula]
MAGFADHKFFSENGVRWSEFARLSYFDLVRNTIVDPMHNMLLGLAKTQWYTEWIKTKSLRPSTKREARELSMIHQFLEEFEAPLWAGRLPLRVGEPAGGSLTADEYKFAATAPWPIIVPIVWEAFLDKTEIAAQRAATIKYRADLENYQQALASRRRGRKPTPPERPDRPRLHFEEPVNFLRFSTALKLLLARKLYGTEKMKPNHHWVIHAPEQIRDYGPVYNFWAFLTERLNKVLKNMNSNNQMGQLEVSMMREFNRAARIEAHVSAHLS